MVQLPRGPGSSRPQGDGQHSARPAGPQHVANAIAFPAAPDTEYITGITLPVDGGYAAQ